MKKYLAIGLMSVMMVGGMHANNCSVEVLKKGSTLGAKYASYYLNPEQLPFINSRKVAGSISAAIAKTWLLYYTCKYSWKASRWALGYSNNAAKNDSADEDSE